MKVNEILENLAANNSGNFKLDFLIQHKDNVNLKEVVRLALDPHIQFYIRKIPAYTPVVSSLRNALSLSEALSKLGQLSGRKVTGNAASDFLGDLLASLHTDDAKVIEKIIGKDLRCGVSRSIANKVWGDLGQSNEKLGEKFWKSLKYPVMLCAQFEEKLIAKMHFPAMVQLKMDGMRFNAVVKDGTCDFRSRKGTKLHLRGCLEQEFIKAAKGQDIVFDGELNVEGMGRKEGNGILNKAGKGTISKAEAELVYATIWDSIPFEDFVAEENNENYDYRFARVQAAWKRVGSDKIRLVKFEFVNNYEEAKKVFEEYYAQGLEGIILKNVQSAWQPKRVNHQIKVKGEEEADLKIVGYYEGKGKAAGMLGGLNCETSDGILKVDVGSGYSDEERKRLWKIRTKLVGKVVAVKYNCRITDSAGDWCLFLPIYVEVREDKDEANSFEELK